MTRSQTWRPGIGSLVVLSHGVLAVAAWHSGLDQPRSSPPHPPALQVHLLPGVASPVQPPHPPLPCLPTVAAPAWQPLTVPSLQLALPAVAQAATAAVASAAADAPAPASAPAPAPAQTEANHVAPSPARASTLPNLAAAPADIARSLRAAQADHRHCAPAPYPPALRERGIEGAVTLRVRVDTQGHAVDVRVMSGSGFRLFDEAALRQVRSCRFQPAMRGDAALESWVEFPVRFALQAG